MWPFGSLYGNQVDAWAALVIDKASMEKAIQDKLIALVKVKELQNLEIRHEGVRFDDSIFVGGGMRALEHLVFKQALGDGAIATVAVRVAPQGAHDLGISWRLMERNWLTELLQNLPAYILWFVSFISLMAFLSGGNANQALGFLCGVPAFFWAWVLYGSTSTHQRVGTRMLLVAVDHALMQALEELGVEPEEVRVVRAAQSEGVGRLRGPE